LSNQSTHLCWGSLSADIRWCNDAFPGQMHDACDPNLQNIEGSFLTFERLRNPYDPGLASSLLIREGFMTDMESIAMNSMPACECEEAVTIDLHALTRHHMESNVVESCNQPLTAWPRPVSPSCRSRHRSSRWPREEQETDRDACRLWQLTRAETLARTLNGDGSGCFCLPG
jgi:hypothetical protein